MQMIFFLARNTGDNGGGTGLVLSIPLSEQRSKSQARESTDY